MNKTKKECLRLVLERILRCPCVWDESPRPFMPPTTKKLATLSINSVMQKGFDDRRTVYSPLTKKIHNNLTGLRFYTLSVRLEILSEGDAADDISIIRFGLFDREIQDILHKQELAVQQILSVVKIKGAKVDGRILSTAVADVKVTSAESYCYGDDEIVESADISPDTLEP